MTRAELRREGIHRYGITVASHLFNRAKQNISGREREQDNQDQIKELYS